MFPYSFVKGGDKRRMDKITYQQVKWLIKHQLILIIIDMSK